jgi:adenylate cyclase
MNTQDFKRKLTAVFSADAAGYSRLMGENEAATVKTLEAYKQVMFSLIKQHRGRVIDSPGDNILAEFASVVDAVQCGVAVQKELQARNADLPGNRRMQFRIGINLGDVIEEGERIYGDGVNIAARLESLADPGGICISKTAFDQIETKLPLGYRYIGEQTVKNIAKAVGAYKVLMEPRIIVEEKEEKTKGIAFWRRKPILAGAVAILIVIIGLAVWNFHFRTPCIEAASKEKMAFPLPDVPSIAVMPFVNMSGDPKQEFLSDGITENIITALSKVPDLFLIGRTSAFTYKGKPVKVKQVSEELGVQYVLEGSVQRSADRIRITAQLIDALNGHQIWAERYDRDVTDLFALQDEITLKILKAIQVKVTGWETTSAIAYTGGKQDLDCYLKEMEGMGHVERVNIEDNNVARRIAEEAMAMCPERLKPYYLMAYIHLMDYLFGTGKSPRESIDKGIELAQKSIAVDDKRAESHALLGQLYCLRKEWDKAIAEGERAVALNPSGVSAKMQYARILESAGRPEEARLLLEQEIRHNPVCASTFYFYGNALRQTGRFEEAVSAYKKALQREPNNFFAHVRLAATYSMMGREKEAQTEAAEVLRLNPKFSLDSYGKVLSATSKGPTGIEKFITALRNAGLK